MRTDQVGPFTIEQLETRAYLSVSDVATTELRDGVVRVRGTSGDDEIRFNLLITDSTSNGFSRTLAVIVNDHITSFAFEEIRRLVIDGGAGNDTIELLSFSPSTDWTISPPLPAPTFARNVVVRGGAGNDTIISGGGDDKYNLFGDAGDDSLIGAIGNDTMFGGGGTDFIDAPGRRARGEGGDGDDTVLRDNSAELPGGASIVRTSDGTLNIKGTSGDDLIAVYTPIGPFLEGPPTDVFLNGVTRSFGWSGDVSVPGIRRIVVDARGGNDHVRLDGKIPGSSGFTVGSSARTFVEVPATLIGGQGDDTLVGGYAGDRLLGGVGNDQYGLTPDPFDGDDTIVTGGGTDQTFSVP